jgi:hypothetical protein
MPVSKGLDQNLEKSLMLCRCYGVLSAYHGRSAFFSGCVSGSTTEENSDQDKSDTSGLLESCLQLFPFHFSFLWCSKWVLKCVALRAWMPRDGLDVSCIEIGSLSTGDLIYCTSIMLIICVLFFEEIYCNLNFHFPKSCNLQGKLEVTAPDQSDPSGIGLFLALAEPSARSDPPGHVVNGSTPFSYGSWIISFLCGSI